MDDYKYILIHYSFGDSIYIIGHYNFTLISILERSNVKKCGMWDFTLITPWEKSNERNNFNDHALLFSSLVRSL